MNRWLLFPFFVVLWAGSAFGGEGPTVAEQDFNTPEAAVGEFLEGFKLGDLDRMLSACAVNESSAKFDLRRLSQRNNMLLLLRWNAPATSPLNQGLNRLEALGFLARQIKFLSYSLLLDQRFLGLPVSPVDDALIDEVLRKDDPSRLSTLTVVRVDSPVPDLEPTDQYRTIARNQAAVFGAEDSRDRIAVILFEDQYYLLGFHLLKYGAAWKIDSLNSPMGGTSIAGDARKTSLEALEKLLKGN